MGNINVDPTVRRAAPCHNFDVRTARDDISRGALQTSGIIALHKTLHAPVKQVAPAPRNPSSSTVPLSAGLTHQQARGVELHHLHVHTACPHLIRHSQAIRGFLG